ncbi:hypothetical protein F4821DRAFT_266146 [Hypoxylon rubiginosum]|uniref:Uncharacterized protein n=1 Tax=Hypoxylon rubiginosum TaxID=110542 RepID=A0ACC0CII7_9PEZI|nr:hypothetical protein F4821DRAFT_266146 [Hypoxylon rubiginosum]
MGIQHRHLWLKLGRRGTDTTIQKATDLAEVVFTGSPSLLLFVGRSAKEEVLQALAKSRSQRSRPGEIHIQWNGVPNRTYEERTFLFADGPPDLEDLEDLQDRRDQGRESVAAGEVIGWAADDETAALPAVYARVLSPFADIVCVFLSDFHGLAGLVQFLAAWLRHVDESSSLPLPQLLIVIDEPDTNPEWAPCWIEGFLGLLRQETTTPLEQGFSGVSLHIVPRAKKLTEAAQTTSFRDVLLATADRSRRARIEHGRQYTMRQLTCSFADAYRAFVSKETFNPIVSTRVANPVPADAARYMTVFLRNFVHDKAWESFALPVLASTVILDGFPPEMHQFHPVAVYDALYHAVWKRVVRALRLPTKAESCLREVIGARYTPEGAPFNKEGHRQRMQSFSNRWKTYRNDKTCLMCLSRKPEYWLPCGHSFCETDIRRFGTQVSPSIFLVDPCFLCTRTTSGLQFTLKPPTKGVNVLGIDGGGIKGIIPLEILDRLEQHTQHLLPGFPIQDFFHMAMGTSSGGLIVLAAFLQGVPISKCIPIFQSLSLQAFRRRFGSSNSILFRCISFLVSLCKDSVYACRHIEEALRAQFGEEDNLLDSSAAAARGAKVGVTVTGVPNGEYIMTNYNGVGAKKPRDTYRHAIPTGANKGIKIWEAYRSRHQCGTLVFTPHFIKGIGWCQDGGLWRNSPLDIAKCEAKKIWPQVARPDVTLSLGTGYEKGIASPPSPNSPSTPCTPNASNSPTASATSTTSTTSRISRPTNQKGVSRFLKRILQSFLHSIVMDGEKFHAASRQWDQEPDEPTRHYRLNVELPSPLPALDDVRAIDTLRCETRRQYTHSTELETLADTLVATLFYLEITAWPIRNRKNVTCRGRILCHLEPGPILAHFINTLQKRGAEFMVSGKTVPLVGNSHDDWNESLFQQPVHICVPTLHSTFPISMRYYDGNRYKEHSISASPFTINSLLQAQGWNQPFGREDHGPTGPVTDGTRKRRRPLRAAEPRKRPLSLAGYHKVF